MLPLGTNDQKHTPNPFTLRSPITEAELEHKSERSWLHSKTLDKSTFCKCMKSLSKSKSPGLLRVGLIKHKAWFQARTLKRSRPTH